MCHWERPCSHWQLYKRISVEHCLVSCCMSHAVSGIINVQCDVTGPRRALTACQRQSPACASPLQRCLNQQRLHKNLLLQRLAGVVASQPQPPAMPATRLLLLQLLLDPPDISSIASWRCLAVPAEGPGPSTMPATLDMTLQKQQSPSLM